MNVLLTAPPASGEVQVWAINTTDPPLSEDALADLLTEEERRRVARFLRSEDRRRAVVSRGVLRLLLGQCHAGAPRTLEFAATEHGKPALRGAGPEFNVSHSGDWVLIALSGAGPVGVDVEQIRQVHDLEAIAERYFAPAEARAIRALAPAERTEAFFTCWTRKEAFVKAMGLGLQAPLDRFTVSLVRDGLPAPVGLDTADETAGPWTLFDATPAAGYVAAVAVGGHDPRLTRRCWSATAGITTPTADGS
jgi:4'-phosphopantetheinyl transferase